MDFVELLRYVQSQWATAKSSITHRSISGHGQGAQSSKVEPESINLVLACALNTKTSIPQSTQISCPRWPF